MAISHRSDISRQIVLGNTEVFTRNFDSFPIEYTNFTTPKKATKETEYYDSMGNIDGAQEKPEGKSIQYRKISEAYQTSIKTKTWTNGFGYTNEAIKYDLQSVLRAAQAKELARTMRELEEEKAIYWIDNATSVTLSDGAAFWSASKPLLNSGDTNDTLTTGPLTPTNVQDAWKKFPLFKNHSGGPMKAKPTDGLTHAVNMSKVEEIWGSTNRAYELSNTKTSVPPIQWHYSTYMSSQTAWMLWDRSYEHILFQTYQKTVFGQADDKINSPGDMYFHALAYWNTGCLPNIGVVGSLGT